MKITIANKRLERKPTTNEKGSYFKDIIFKTGNFEIKQLEDIIKNGYTITYLYKDNCFERRQNYMKNNYLGTQFICVDVDSCDINPIEFVGNIKFKPTIYHTTFSNLTKEKQYKWCFHLIYCFDDIIYVEDNFKKIFDIITEDYLTSVDANAKDCHRCIFTSNSNLDNFILANTGIIYKVQDFINEESIKYDELDTFFDDKPCWEKINFLDKSILSNNLSSEEKISQSENGNTRSADNSFNLDAVFFNDLNSMNRSDFIRKYEIKYQYVTHTIINEALFIDGYADVRNINYYIVPSAQYKWNASKSKAEIQKVKNGNRNTILFLDAIAFMKIIPNISKEYLVYLLVTEVYKNFINADGQLNNWFIVNKAKEVWNNIDNLSLNPVKKSFVIDKNYWLMRGYNNWLQVSKIIMKKMKSGDFGQLYDFNCTVEENIKYMKLYCISTKKQTLIRWLEENGYSYKTDKEYRNNRIIEVYKDNKKLSSRMIENILKNEGIKVSYKTIQTVIKEY